MEYLPLLRTVGIILAPILLPRLYIFLTAPRPKRVPRPSTHSNGYNKLRRWLLLFVLAIIVPRVLLQRSESNLFLDLAPSKSLAQRLFPLLRTPLDIRTPLPTLRALWLASPSKRTSEREIETTLNLLSSMEGRKRYLAFSTLLEECEWCDRDKGDWRREGTLILLPELLGGYLGILTFIGIMLEGSRRRWRIYLLALLAVSGAGEIFALLNFDTKPPMVPLYSFLQFYRPIFFLLIVVIVYFLPETWEQEVKTLSERVGPRMGELQSGTVRALQKLRAGNLERMALMREEGTREKVSLLVLWRSVEVEADKSLGCKILDRFGKGSEYRKF